MALPLPRVVADVGPGGGLVTAMGGINALNNALHTTRFNKVKADYAPLSIPAQAYSQLAYANAVAPQFLAKILNNPAALGNMSESEKRNLLNGVLQAGGQGSPANTFGQMPGAPSGQNNINSLGQRLSNMLHGFLGQPRGRNFNTLAQPVTPQATGRPGYMTPHGFQGSLTGAPAPDYYSNTGPDEKALDEAINRIDRAQNNTATPMQLELNEGQSGQRPPTWSENAGKQIGIQKEGEELGKIRANDIKDISQQNLQLSNTGNVVDQLIDDFTNPDFINLREKFPFLQDMQLKLAAKTDNPIQRELIGKIMADIEQFKGQTVNSFKGQTLKREFDYADKLKPSPEDTVYTALGKLESLKTLKDIAETKNNIIIDLMQNKHMNLNDAIKEANKRVDVKSIANKVKDLTSPSITIKNKKTGNYMSFTKARAEELGIPYEKF